MNFFQYIFSHFSLLKGLLLIVLFIISGCEKSVKEKPNTQIQKIESIIPTPLGDLFVKWDLDSQQKRILQLVIPQGMEIKLRMSSFDIPKGKPLQINGKPVLLKGNQKSFYPLPSGKWEGVF